jgi:hypothetical protein
MKHLLTGAFALVALSAGAANASTMTIDYFQIADTAGPDFSVCCTSPPATLPNIAIGSSLSDGLPVTTIGGTYDVKMVNSKGEILWWTPSVATGVTYEGSSGINLPYNNGNMFAPQGNGANNKTNFQTAIVTGTIHGTGADVKLTVSSDDDALVYLGGKYVGGLPGVHSTQTKTLDFGIISGDESLQVFYADRAQVAAVLALDVTGAIVSNSPGYSAVGGVPEPSSWAMLILGFCGVGFLAYRRKPSGQQFRVA